MGRSYLAGGRPWEKIFSQISPNARGPAPYGPCYLRTCTVICHPVATVTTGIPSARFPVRPITTPVTTQRAEKTIWAQASAVRPLSEESAAGVG